MSASKPAQLHTGGSQSPSRLTLRGAARPLVVSVLVTTCFAWTALALAAERTPLPQTIGAVAFLLLIVFEDVRRMRIPNALTFPALAAALGLALVTGGASGIVASLSGAFVALAIFFVPFAFRILGAGDVKAMMVFGALFGSKTLVGMAWWMILVGGLLAIGILAAQPGALRDLVIRWSKSAWFSLRLRRLVYLPPARGTVAAAGLPYAVAMGLGAAAFQLWELPWI